MNKNLLNSSYFITFLIFCAVLFPMHSNAAIVEIDSDVTLSEDDVYNENLIVVGGQTNIKSDVNGDVTALFGDGVVSGDITGDLLIFSGSVFVRGNVSGDVRVVGGDVTLQGQVGGDVIAIGGNIKLSRDARVGNDFLIIGGDVNIEGQIGGDIHSLTNSLYLNNIIQNTGTITTQHIALGPRANISGDVKYFAPQKAQIDPASSITGTFSYNKINALQDSAMVKRAVLQFINFWLILRLITTLVLAFILIQIFKPFSQKVTDYVLSSYFRALGIGALVLICIPILSFILFISLFAMPIGILLMLAYFFTIIISAAIASIFVGALIRNLIDKKQTNEVTFTNALMGALILTLLQFIPYFGDLIRFLITIIAIGGVSHYLYKNIRWREIK